ncbi:hypothetical protein R1sor_009556 [Riccia sorocarpa]|uniref:Uncharacterized protein n=1 Tax=Riccia sorocarpa TaxID=122646 RepID=A0ABD3HZF4_9MARC
MESVLHIRVCSSSFRHHQISMSPSSFKLTPSCKRLAVKCASRKGGNSTVSSRDLAQKLPRKPVSETSHAGFNCNSALRARVSVHERNDWGCKRLLLCLCHAAFDGVVLLKRSEELYTKLIAEYEGEVREFIVCVRQKSEQNSKPVLDDWLPVAELAPVSEQEASSILSQALPVLYREVAECAAKGALALRSISRNWCVLFQCILTNFLPLN